MKKVALIVAVILACCLAIPLFVGCKETPVLKTKDGSWQVSVSEQNEVTLDKYLGDEAEVIVPAKVSVEGKGDDLSVVALGDSAFMKIDDGKGKWRTRETYTANTTLKKVTFEGDIKSIGNMAFYLCSALESITLPDSVESVGDFAFFGCEKLTSILLPAACKSIGAYSFRACSSLSEVKVLATDKLPDLGDKAFYLVNEKASDDDQYYIIPTLKIYVPAEALSLYDPDAIEKERRETKLNNHRYWTEYINAGCFPQLAKD